MGRRSKTVSLTGNINKNEQTVKYIIREVKKQLTEENAVLTRIDNIAIKNLEQNLFILYEAYDCIIKRGVVIETISGDIRKNPAMDIFKATNSTILSILKEYGMTAKARLFLPQLAPTERQSPIEEFFNKDKKKSIKKEFIKR